MDGVNLLSVGKFKIGPKIFRFDLIFQHFTSIPEVGQILQVSDLLPYR